MEGGATFIKSVTKKWIDRSSPERFSFSFFCDRCGWEWRSEDILFNAEGFTMPLDDAVRSMLWIDQRRAAYDRANTEALFMFNHCSICGDRVCDDCFYIVDSVRPNICDNCAKRGKTGE